MATQSIMKNIVITDPEAAEMFVNAMEQAAQTAESGVPYKMESRDLSADELKKYFGAIKGNVKHKGI